MLLLTKKRLRLFWQQHRDAETSLRAWARTVKAARWKSWKDVKEVYGSADVLKSGRVVFDIKGNKYRMVVAFVYAKEGRNGIAVVKFLGTHEEYDRINADEV